MNDIFHTKEMKPPLFSYAWRCPSIFKKSVTLILINQGKVLGLKNQVADSGGHIADRLLTEGGTWEGEKQKF